MKTKYIIITAIIGLSIMQACDKLEEPYIKDDIIVWNGRKSVIFDFTGQRCGNCPNAHETINGLIDTYGDAIIPIAIHATSYAKPATDDTTQAYYYDFRTDVGDYLGGRDYSFGYYGELYLPTGMVNSYSATDFTTPSLWGANVVEYISLYPEFLITIDGNYNNLDSTINCSVDIITNIANNRQLSLTVFVLEDHILQWQKYYGKDPDDIEGYEHNHVLRVGMNGPFGEPIKENTSNSNIGDIVINKSYSTKIGIDWIIENCLIVAFVYDTDTEEILQAEQFHLND